MAYATKAQYAILMKNPQGQLLARQLASMSQEVFQARFNQLFGAKGTAKASPDAQKQAANAKVGYGKAGKADKDEKRRGEPAKVEHPGQKDGGEKDSLYEKYRQFCERTNRKSVSKEGFEGVQAFFGRG